MPRKLEPSKKTLVACLLGQMAATSVSYGVDEQISNNQAYYLSDTYTQLKEGGGGTVYNGTVNSVEIGTTESLDSEYIQKIPNGEKRLYILGDGLEFYQVDNTYKLNKGMVSATGKSAISLQSGSSVDDYSIYNGGEIIRNDSGDTIDMSGATTAGTISIFNGYQLSTDIYPYLHHGSFDYYPGGTPYPTDYNDPVIKCNSGYNAINFSNAVTSLHLTQNNGTIKGTIIGSNSADVFNINNGTLDANGNGIAINGSDGGATINITNSPNIIGNIVLPETVDNVLNIGTKGGSGVASNFSTQGDITNAQLINVNKTSGADGFVINNNISGIKNFTVNTGTKVTIADNTVSGVDAGSVLENAGTVVMKNTGILDMPFNFKNTNGAVLQLEGGEVKQPITGDITVDNTIKVTGNFTTGNTVEQVKLIEITGELVAKHEISNTEEKAKVSINGGVLTLNDDGVINMPVKFSDNGGMINLAGGQLASPVEGNKINAYINIVKDSTASDALSQVTSIGNLLVNTNNFTIDTAVKGITYNFSTAINTVTNIVSSGDVSGGAAISNAGILRVDGGTIGNNVPMGNVVNVGTIDIAGNVKVKAFTNGKHTEGNGPLTTVETFDVIANSTGAKGGSFSDATNQTIDYNQAPTVTDLSPQYIDGNTIKNPPLKILFGPGDSYQITIKDDVSNPTDKQTLILMANNGTLQLTNDPPINTIVTGRNTSTMTVYDTLSNLQTVLNDLELQSNISKYGTVGLTVILNDNGTKITLAQGNSDVSSNNSNEHTTVGHLNITSGNTVTHNVTNQQGTINISGGDLSAYIANANQIINNTKQTVNITDSGTIGKNKIFKSIENSGTLNVEGESAAINVGAINLLKGSLMTTSGTINAPVLFKEDGAVLTISGGVLNKDVSKDDSVSESTIKIDGKYATTRNFNKIKAIVITEKGNFTINQAITNITDTKNSGKVIIEKGISNTATFTNNHSAAELNITSGILQANSVDNIKGLISISGGDLSGIDNTAFLANGAEQTIEITGDGTIGKKVKLDKIYNEGVFNLANGNLFSANLTNSVGGVININANGKVAENITFNNYGLINLNTGGIIEPVIIFGSSGGIVNLAGGTVTKVIGGDDNTNQKGTVRLSTDLTYDGVNNPIIKNIQTIEAAANNLSVNGVLDGFHDKLTINKNALVTVNQSGNITGAGANSYISNEGTLTVNTGGTIAVPVRFGADGGTLNLYGGSITAEIRGDKSSKKGDINVNNNFVYTNTSPNISNIATLNVKSGELNINKPITEINSSFMIAENAKATINSGGYVSGKGSVYNAGTLNVSGGTIGTASTSNSGKIIIDNGGEIIGFDSESVLQNSGEITLNSGGKINVDVDFGDVDTGVLNLAGTDILFNTIKGNNTGAINVNNNFTYNNQEITGVNTITVNSPYRLLIDSNSALAVNNINNYGTLKITKGTLNASFINHHAGYVSVNDTGKIAADINITTGLAQLIINGGAIDGKITGYENGNSTIHINNDFATEGDIDKIHNINLNQKTFTINNPITNLNGSFNTLYDTVTDIKSGGKIAGVGSINNTGTINLSSGEIAVGNIYNNGIFKVNNASGKINGGNLINNGSANNAANIVNNDLFNFYGNININVTPLALVLDLNNEAITDKIPGAQTVAQNTNIVFSADNNNSITIDGMDRNGGTVKLEASHGTISVTNTNNLTGISGNSSSIVYLSGTLDNLNNALQELTFLPELNYVGSDANLKIVVQNDKLTTSEVLTEEFIPIVPPNIPEGYTPSFEVSAGDVQLNNVTNNSIINISGGTVKVNSLNNKLGTINISNSGKISNSTLVNDSIINTAGGSISNSSFINKGTLNINGAFAIKDNNFENSNIGIVNLKADLTLDSGKTLNNYGIVNILEDVALIGGNYTVKSEGIHMVNINNDNVKKLTIDGNAIFEANAIININNNETGLVPNNKNYNIITANSFTDGGVKVLGSTELVSYVSEINGNNLSITTTRKPLITVTKAKGNLGATPLAKVLDDLIDNGATGDLRTALVNLDRLKSEEAVNDAVNQLMPETNITPEVNWAPPSMVFGAVAERFDMVARAGINNLQTGYSSGSMQANSNFWLKGLAGFINQDNRKTLPGYRANSAGLAFGLDRELFDDFWVGMGFSSVGTHINNKNTSSKKTKVTSRQVTLYSSFSPSSFYIDALVAMAFNNYRIARSINYNNLNYTAKASYHAIQPSAKISSGIIWNFYNDLQLIPNASLQYSLLHSNSYNETGAGGLSLQKVTSSDLTQLEGGVGLKLAALYKEYDQIYNPYITFAVLRDFKSSAQVTNARFLGGGGTFSVVGSVPAKTTYNLGLGFVCVHQDRLNVTINYDLKKKSKFIGHSGSMAVKYAF